MNNKANNDPLSNAFNLTPMDNSIPLKPNGKLIIPDPGDDFEYGRENIIDLIEKGNQMLGEFAQVAASAQEPRHYEVLTNLLNSLIDANEKLMNLKKSQLDIKEKQKKLDGNIDDSPDTHNTNIFVGSTSDLQNLLEKARKHKAIDNDDSGT